MSTNQVPFIDLAAQFAAIGTELQQVVLDAIGRTDFILGEAVRQFEAEFAAFCEADHAIGVDSGTSALELALRAFDIGPGDEVITAANTFIATALAITYTGARPVLVDTDPYTYTINTAQIEPAITPHTRAIIPVHLYGQPAHMDPIISLARQHNLIVIEDACQAHGAYYQGKRVGSLGHAAAFSFYPAKNLGGCGDGGIIVTNDPQVANRVRMLRDYGQSKKYHHDVIGFNHRLDTLQAAILRVKLRHLDDWNQARRSHAQLYTHLLCGNGIMLPVQANYAEPVWHLYVIQTRHRDALRDHLAKHGISTGIHYPIPIHRQQAYYHLGYAPGSFPCTERSADRILSLPMYAELTPEMVEYVANTINAYEHEDQETPALEAH